MLAYKDGIIRIIGNASVVTKDCSPKFSGWTYEMYQNDPELRFLEPMTAYECDKKSIPGKSYIAEEKFDGHRSLCFLTTKGNRFFSRRISKKTGWYAENTDCLPHLRDYCGMSNYIGTVLDGEITMPTFADVQSVTGALPETALANQIEKGFAVYNVFDILYYKGINIQMMPLWKRKLYLAKVFRSNWMPNMIEVPYYSSEETADEFVKLKEAEKEAKWYLAPVPKIVESFPKLLEKMWEEGKEGLIIKNLYGTYQQKRSKNSLKLKEEKTYDVVIMGFQEPTKDYDGKTLDEKGYWDYWVCYDDPDFPIIKRMSVEDAGDYAPVTKPYAMGWIGAIDVGVYRNGKLVKIAEVKGITDADQEKIAERRIDLIGQVIEIKAQGVINPETKSLRHPRFNRWRDDKNAEDCKWELIE